MNYTFVGNETDSELNIPVWLQISSTSPPLEDRSTTYLGKGLIDTGATCTGIHRSVQENLGLGISHRARISTPTSSNTTADVCIFRLGFMNGLSIDNLHAVVLDESLSAVEGRMIDCLIGIDVLRKGYFAYNGELRQFLFQYGYGTPARS